MESDRKGKGGPQTARGKAKVRHNAVKHGLAARTLVIDGVEDAAEYAALLAALVDEYQPVGPTEAFFVEFAATQMWHLRRAAAFAVGAIAARQASADADVAAGRRERWLFAPDVPPADARDAYASAPRSLADARDRVTGCRQTQALLGRFARAQNGVVLAGEHANVILDRLADAGGLDYGGIVPLAATPPAAAPLGAAPPAAEQVVEARDWSVGQLWGIIAEWVAAGERTADGLLASATLAAAVALDLAEHEAREYEAELALERRQRVLPPADVLQVLERHEPHRLKLLLVALDRLADAQEQRLKREKPRAGATRAAPPRELGAPAAPDSAGTTPDP